MTIRVLMCGSVPPEWGGATVGGVATFHRALTETFLRHGKRWGVEVSGILPLNLDPSSRHAPPVPLIGPVTTGTELDHYRKALRGIDVVLFQHIAHRWPSYHACLDPRVPAVGVVHSWHSVTQRPPDRSAAARRTVEKALPGCDALVFVSYRTRKEGLELGFTYPEQATVIHNPVGAGFLAPPRWPRRREGWLFVGALIDRKNPIAVLRAAARRGKRLTIIGTGEQEQRLRAATDRLGIGHAVTFLGQTSPQRVRRELLAAEMLCVPSKSEGFSMAYLEALACGTPVVGAGANIAEIAERLQMPCGVGVWAGTAAEVADATARVEQTEWDRPRLRERVLAAFAPEITAQAYALLLHEVVGARS